MHAHSPYIKLQGQSPCTSLQLACLRSSLPTPSLHHAGCAYCVQAAAACSDDSERYCHIPAVLEEQLMPFQREGVKFALRHGGRCLIGDEVCAAAP